MLQNEVNHPHARLGWFGKGRMWDMWVCSRVSDHRCWTSASVEVMLCFALVHPHVDRCRVDGCSLQPGRAQWRQPLNLG